MGGKTNIIRIRMLHQERFTTPRCPFGAINSMSKATLILLLVCLTTQLARSQQGNVIFNNRVVSEGISAPVYDETVGGTMLAGTAYRAQLYGGPVGTPENLLQPTGAIVDFRTGSAAGYVNVGIDSNRSIPGVAAGQNAVVQIRAWAAAGGATYEQARTNFTADSKIGRSNVLTVPTPPSILNPPASLVGLQGFAVQAPTRPTIAISATRATAQLSGADEALSYLIQWPADGTTYDLESSADPNPSAQWQPVATAPVLNGSNYSVTIAVQSTPSFFRLKVR